MGKFFWCKGGLFALENVLAPFGESMFASGTKTHPGHSGVRRWLLGADANWRLSCQSVPFPFSACWPHDLPGKLTASVCCDVSRRSLATDSGSAATSKMQCATVVAQLAGVHFPPRDGRSGLFCAAQTSTSCERARRSASWVCVFQADVNIRSSSAACL